jgi:hypothetical protein
MKDDGELIAIFVTIVVKVKNRTGAKRRPTN